MKKNTLISLVIAVIVFAIILFLLVDSVTCTDVSKETCFNSVLFDPTLIFVAFIAGIIAFAVSYFVTKRLQFGQSAV